MFAWIDEYGYFSPEVDIELGNKLYPRLKTWGHYLESSKRIIPR